MILLSVTTIISSVFVFLFVIITLVGLLLFVKAKLSPSGKIKIKINGEKEIEVDGGGTLLSTLSNEGIFLPSACGGGGTCVQCTCQVHSGGGGILPTVLNDVRLLFESISFNKWAENAPKITDIVHRIIPILKNFSVVIF